MFNCDNACCYWESAGFYIGFNISIEFSWEHKFCFCKNKYILYLVCQCFNCNSLKIERFWNVNYGYTCPL